MRGSNPTIEAVPALGNASICYLWLGPLLVAITTFVATLLTLDPAGDRPRLPEGPGLTTDEVLNIEAGLVLWLDLGKSGWGIIDPTSWYDAYAAPHYQSDYPPLGRLILAASHESMQAIWPVEVDPGLPSRPYFTVQARVASAAALAMTVFLIGWFASRWFGRLAGVIAALSLPLMPRLFAQAHIASIESIVGLFFTWTVLVTVDRWPRAIRAHRLSPTTRSGWSIPWGPPVVTGLLLGLTLLTKIQGVLFPIPFAIWAIFRFGRRGLVGVAIVGAISALVLFVGWPWLWIDPVRHTRDYFLPSGRDHLFCWYLGERYLDRDVPWHFPFVIFASTVPVGLHLLGSSGAITELRSALRRRDDDRPAFELLAALIVFPLVLFALPGITVYDGERLFLVSFPLWGVLIGRGSTMLYEKLSACSQAAGASASIMHSRRAWLAGSILFVLLFGESYSLVTLHPCQLSYYNWFVGGLRGASALGLERTYWGDSITRTLHQQIVEQVPAGSTIHVAPVLHPLQLPGMALQSPLLQKQQIELEAYDDSIRQEVGYVLVFRRMADPRDSLNEPTVPGMTDPPGLKRLAEVRLDQVQLAVLYAVIDNP